MKTKSVSPDLLRRTVSFLAARVVRVGWDFVDGGVGGGAGGEVEGCTQCAACSRNVHFFSQVDAQCRESGTVLVRERLESTPALTGGGGGEGVEGKKWRCPPKRKHCP